VGLLIHKRRYKNEINVQTLPTPKREADGEYGDDSWPFGMQEGDTF